MRKYLFRAANVRWRCAQYFVSLGVLKYVGVRGVLDVVFSVCIVTRGTVGDRVWEV